MKAAILLILGTNIVYGQSINIQRGRNTGGYSDSPELITQAPEPITAGNRLRMYELVSSLYTNKTKYKSSIRITVTHKDKIAQKPDVCVARVDPATRPGAIQAAQFLSRADEPRCRGECGYADGRYAECDNRLRSSAHEYFQTLGP